MSMLALLRCWHNWRSDFGGTPIFSRFDEAKRYFGFLRISVATLRGEPSLNCPLPEAIESLLSVCRAQGLIIELTTQGKFRVLTPQVDLTLYRVAQEALTNVSKHVLASFAVKGEKLLNQYPGKIGRH